MTQKRKGMTKDLVKKLIYCVVLLINVGLLVGLTLLYFKVKSLVAISSFSITTSAIPQISLRVGAVPPAGLDTAQSVKRG